MNNQYDNYNSKEYKGIKRNDFVEITYLENNSLNEISNKKEIYQTQLNSDLELYCWLEKNNQAKVEKYTQVKE